MARWGRWRFVRRAGRDMRAASGIIIAAAAMTTLSLLLALEGQAWLEGRLQQLEHYGLWLLPSQTQPEVLTSLAAQLAKREGLTASVLSAERRAQQVGFWLGDETPLAALPLPQAIRLNFANPLSATALDQLRKDSQTLAPQSELMIHGHWGSRLRQLVRVGQGIALMAGVGLLAALMACISLACRARLAAHQAALELLPLLGASPAFLARHFSRQFFRATLLASSIGLLLAGLILIAGRALLFLLLDIHPLVLWPAVSNQILALLALIPLLCALIASETAKRQALRWLKEMDLA